LDDLDIRKWYIIALSQCFELSSAEADRSFIFVHMSGVKA